MLLWTVGKSCYFRYYNLSYAQAIRLVMTFVEEHNIPKYSLDFAFILIEIEKVQIII